MPTIVYNTKTGDIVSIYDIQGVEPDRFEQVLGENKYTDADMKRVRVSDEDAPYEKGTEAVMKWATRKLAELQP
jgi:phosphoribosyl 1,2-cyclic phosphodiesterase